MFNGLNVQMPEHQFYMDTSTLANLKLTDKNEPFTNQVQIDQQNLINNDPQDYYQGTFNEFYSSDSPVLITDLDQTSINIKTENQNEQLIEENSNNDQFKKSSVSSKICKVCGDKSLGYNFSQVTCESCKAFFRRNALRDKNFKCPFADNCEIDIVTRRFCQKCRLRKCFEIGMKSEWIMSDEEKRRKRLKIEENKKKKRSKQTSFSSPTNQLLSPFSMDANTNSQSINSPNNSPLPTSTFVPLDQFNPIVYNPQIDNSIMQLDSNYHAQSNNPNYLSDQEPKHIQQPEIVGQLVQSHYDQYKQNSNYDPIFNLDMSPQYSSSISSNTTGLTDQFFGDFSNSQSSFNNFTSNNSTSLPMNTIGTVSNNSNISNDVDVLPVIYSPSNNNDNVNYVEIAKIPNSARPPQAPLISRFLTINCLPDSEMVEMIFEQSASSVLRPKMPIDNDLNTNLDKLSRNEMDLINELLYSTSNVGCLMSALTTGESIPPENVIFELLRMTDYAVRKCVKVAKKISFFRSLCEEDQISALKGSSTEIMLIRTIGMYDESTDSIIKHEYIGKPKISLEILKSIREDIYYEHKEMILSFKREIRQDSTLVSILMAILLFQPDRPHIQHRMTMKYIQMIYQDLLKRYIYVNFSKENLTIYNELIQSLSGLRTLNEKYIKTYVQLNRDILGPLLMEVFDFGS